ncbi:AraC family transcriptional regulator [Nocardia sp. NBC_00508]|uniref:AraC family transcriptional regulator n=1 Tax=Nocardia sp. NBC_00508 TaxID=2975992 RepID=UPI002E81BF10|nr:AraC family transcriptional regulator [Nocardia sp. NBC_00508]WUD67809.1 AraC family transcriptional regulator [Nocardia sp. NBC_00508]
MRYSELTVDDAEEWTALSDSFVPMGHRYRAPHTWWGHLTAQDTAAYTLVRTEQSGDKLASRTLSHTRRGPDDFYWLVFPQRGVFTAVENDTSIRLPPGRGLLMRLDRTWRLHMPASVAYAFRVPRVEIDCRLPPGGPPSSSALDMRSGLGRVVQTMLRATHAEHAGLTGREFDAVCDRVGELLCMMSIGDLRPQQSHLAETAESVRQYVRQHIGAGDLRLPAVAAALKWSPRQLRFALQQSGTTYREVRQEAALRAARDLLARPGPNATIGEVAAHCGFTETWFSTAFKARYGETPREFRQRRLSEATSGSAWSGRVATAIDAARAEDTISLESVARRLAVGPRTLQRRLAEEGTTWWRELESARRRYRATAQDR